MLKFMKMGFHFMYFYFSGKKCRWFSGCAYSCLYKRSTRLNEGGARSMLCRHLSGWLGLCLRFWGQLLFCWVAASACSRIYSLIILFLKRWHVLSWTSRGSQLWVQ